MNKAYGMPSGHVGVVTTRSTPWRAQQIFAAQDYETNNIAALDWDVGVKQVRFIQLNVTSTMAFPLNAKRGGTYILVVKQDASGSRALTFSSQLAALGAGTWKWPGGVGPILTTTAGKTDVFTFIFDGTHMLGASQLNY